MKFKVVSINDSTEIKPEGKQYTVYQWKTDAIVDGKSLEGVVLKTLSGKMAALVKVGAELDVEKEMYKNYTNYKIPTPPKQDGGYGGQRSQAQNQNVTNYTLRDLEKLSAWAWGYSVAKFGDMPPEQQASIGASLFIQATKCGLKYESPQAQDAKVFEQKDSQTINKIWEELKKAGLEARCLEKAQDNVLLEWWASVKGDVNKFLFKVNKEIPAVTDDDGNSDNLPF